MDFRTYAQILRRRKWVIIAAIVATLIAAFLGTQAITPTYRAEAVLRVLTSRSGGTSWQPYDVRYAERLVGTYTEVATSTPVLSELRDRLNITTIPDILVEAVSNTELIKITVDDSDPEKAAAVANTLVDIMVARSHDLYTGDALTATESLENRIQQLDSELNQARRDYALAQAETPVDSGLLSDLEHLIQTKEEVYSTLITQYEEARLGDLLRADTIYPIERADVPLSPVSPNLMLNLAFGGLLGVLTGVGLAITLYHFDTRIYTREDLKDKIGLELVGTIPLNRSSNGPLFAPNSISAEALRRLRTTVFSSGREYSPNTLLITSPEPREGKSTVTANLALMLSRTGKRVVLVDADLRRPTQHLIFNLPNEIGLSTVLNDRRTLDVALVEVPGGGLSVLPSGVATDEDIEKLGSPQMVDLLEELSQRFDVVLIDTPAFLAVMDAADIVPYVDGVLVVVSSGKSSRAAITAVQEELAAINAPLLGAVLNRARVSRSRYEYYQHRNGMGDGDSTIPFQAITSTSSAQGWRLNARVLFDRTSTGRRFKQLEMLRISAVSWWDIVALLSVLLWFVAQVILQQQRSIFYGTDALTHYFPIAEHLLDGDLLTAFDKTVFRGPGYPVALAGTSALFGVDLFMASKIVGIVTSTLFLGTAYLLIRRVLDPLTGLITIWLIAATNMFTAVAAGPASNTLFAALTTAAMCFAVCGMRLTYLNSILAGLAAGLAMTVRWEGLILLPGFAFWLALLPRQAFNLQQRARLLLVFLLGFLVAAGPWLYVNNDVHGDPLYTEAGIGVNPDILPVTDSLTESLQQALQQSPVNFFRDYTESLLTSFPDIIKGLNAYPSAGGWVMTGVSWVLVLVGLLFILLRPDRRKVWFFSLSIVWWGVLGLYHYEARYYLPTLPAFAALIGYVFTSATLPDMMLAAGEKRVRLTPGYALHKVRHFRSTEPRAFAVTGAGLAGLVLFAVLLPTALHSIERQQDHAEWTDASLGFYHDLSDFITQLPDSDQLLPIGTRQWSPARYWIPHNTSVAVAPLPWEHAFDTVVPQLSYVLYDQVTSPDELVRYWDDPDLAMLVDPLDAPPEWEAVFYKPESPRAILYHLLDEQSLAPIAELTATSELADRPLVDSVDNDALTWWSTELRDESAVWEFITFELDRPTLINRIWLLPLYDSNEFPSSLSIELSLDGETWSVVAEMQDVPAPLYQSPRIVSFDATTAQFVRLGLGNLAHSRREEGYRASLAEIHISYAIERPTTYPQFTIDASRIAIEGPTNDLLIPIHNERGDPGRATLAIEQAEDWSLRSATHLATLLSSSIPPGGEEVLRLEGDKWVAPGPGECLSACFELQAPTFVYLDLERYGTKLPSTDRVCARNICAPDSISLTDFTGLESPLENGWQIRDEAGDESEVRVVFDRQRDSNVMQITGTPQDSTTLFFDLSQASFRPNLSLWMKTSDDFNLFVDVRASDGNTYYVQYMPTPWDTTSDAYPQGSYVFEILGESVANGSWNYHAFDVLGDFESETGLDVVHIDGLYVRAFGEMLLTDVILDQAVEP